jgi:hypothetical protein
MMMWLKIRLLSGAATSRAEDAVEDYYGEVFTERSVRLARRTRSPYIRPRTARGWYEDEDDEDSY